MKSSILFLAAAAASAWAQVGPPPRPVSAEVAKPAPAAGSITKTAAKPAVSRQALKGPEDIFNTKLATFNQADPVYILGSTRGIYLPSYGAVFSVELDLVQSPTITVFRHSISPQEADQIYARKQKQLPLIRKAMIESMTECARALDSVPANEQIVMVVRLDYQPGWEKTTGLPSQITLHGSRKSVAAGDIEVEEQ